MGAGSLAESDRHRAALLLVDVQYDFLPPSGALAVPGGDAVLPVIHSLLEPPFKWDLLVASQDYHPANHISFASRHAREPFTTIQVSLPPSGDTSDNSAHVQELWPDHCIQGTRGADIEEDLWHRLKHRAVSVIQKGTDIDQDAYSAFAIPLSEHYKKTPALARLLAESGITRLFIVGLATDYCVRASALSALKASAAAPAPWEVLVVRDGVRGVDSVKAEKVLAELEEAGVKIVNMEEARALHQTDLNH